MLDGPPAAPLAEIRRPPHLPSAGSWVNIGGAIFVFHHFESRHESQAFPTSARRRDACGPHERPRCGDGGVRPVRGLAARVRVGEGGAARWIRHRGGHPSAGQDRGRGEPALRYRRERDFRRE